MHGVAAITEIGLGPILTIVVLSVTICMGSYRVFVGPTLPDRVIALDLVAFAAVGIIATYAIATNEGTLLDVALVLSLLVFLGTVAFARYFEKHPRSNNT